MTHKSSRPDHPGCCIGFHFKTATSIQFGSHHVRSPLTIAQGRRSSFAHASQAPPRHQSHQTLPETLEPRRLLTSAYIQAPYTTASEDGAFTAALTFRRFNIDPEQPDDLMTLAYTLTGVGDHPADPTDVALVGDAVNPSLNTYTFTGDGTNEPQVQLLAIQDALYEPDEQVQLSLFNPADMNTPLSSIILTVKSDDGELWIDGGGLMSEQNGNLGFIIHREDLGGAIAFPSTVSVRLKTAGSTVQVLDPNTTSATIDNLTPGQNYSFRVNADNTGSSTQSTSPVAAANTQYQNIGQPLNVPITTDIDAPAPLWLNNGQPLVEGEAYRLVYVSGAVNWAFREGDTWTAAQYAIRADDWSTHQWQLDTGNGFPFVASESQVPPAAHDLTLDFASTGRPIGVYFHGVSESFAGPGVTWQLQKKIPQVSVTLNNGDHTTEGDATPLYITLTRDTYFNEPLTINYTLSPNTADPDDIDIPQSGTLTINADKQAYVVTNGNLRIWKKQAIAARNGRSVADGGDFVPAMGDGLTLNQMGVDDQRTIRLWVEAVQASTQMADQRIQVQIDPDGNGFQPDDAIRLTAINVNIDLLDVTEGKEEVPGGLGFTNDNRDENNRDAAGNPRNDNEEGWDGQKHVHSIVSSDSDLLWGACTSSHRG